jgi:hypothetical protein
MTVTEKQIAALCYLVARARLDPNKPDISKLVRQLVWRLIAASESLTKTVFITLHQETGDFTPDEINQIAWTAGALNSENSTTYLSALLALTGTEFRFNLHYGAFMPEGEFNSDGQFAHQDGHHDAPMRYTFWFGSVPSLETPGTDRVEVRVTRAELEAIDTTKDGLYSS